jgi:urease accessory protein
MAGGDRLTLDIDLAAGSQVLLTSPARPNGMTASVGSQASSCKCASRPGSLLEWLPQETILYAGVPCGWTTSSGLQGDARLLAGEVMCWAARPAANNLTVACGSKAAKSGVTTACCGASTATSPATVLAGSAAGMGGHTVLATLLWAGPALPAELHQACLELPCAGRAAASQLPGIWLARFIGDSAEAAHHWLRACRDLIYPFSHGRAASQPRIWAS